MEFLLKGLLVGLLVAIPVGPIGVLCINRSISRGKISGFISGIGAAVADCVYGYIVAFGLTMVSDLLLEKQIYFKVIGGAVLLILGIKALKKDPISLSREDNSKKGLFKDFLSSFLLTLTSPATMLAFLAIFTGIGIFPQGTNESMLLVLGVFIGSSTWWGIMSIFISWIIKRLNLQHSKYINKGSGVLFLLSGGFVLIGLIIR